ncbi:MAG: glycosyltransferase family 9 protein [Deltaproteobacteria bacterium]|nr:glycosyltransferase family 9 protein [Deltaproteobacteria bacterium]
MAAILEELAALGSEARIIVLRALHLGDLLCAVPALRALRQAVPAAKIELIGLPWSCHFVRRFSSYLDGFLEFPGFDGLPERAPDTAALSRLSESLAKNPPHLIIQMQGSGEMTNRFIGLLPAVKRGGFIPEGSSLRSDTFLEYPDGHEINRLLKLTSHLGASAQASAELEFPLFKSDMELLDCVLGRNRVHETPFVVIHPGSRSSVRWPAERFAALADSLSRQGLHVVLTGVPSESHEAAEVERNMRTTALNLCGLTSIGSLAALIQRARLVICNDTGISHLAAALKVPSVVLFSSSELGRWAPLNRYLHLALSGAPFLSAEQVLKRVQQKLNREARYAA